MIKKSDTKQKIRLSANILFSGIGAQERGFENSGLFDVDLQCTSDICKESVLSYAAIHCGLTNDMVERYENFPPREQMAQDLTEINLGYDPDKDKRFDWFKLARRKNKDLEKYWLANKLSKNLGDISKIEKLPYADLWTTSFPCTDISVAGKMKGLKPDSETRSSLLWCGINLLKTAKDNNELPKYILFENVKNLVSKKFRPDFDNLIDVLSELGFNTYWKVLNGKECGVPQNRERVFVIAIRKDIDTKKMNFPKPFDGRLRLRDILEDEVDKKYYLSDKVLSKFQLYNSCKGTDILIAGSVNPNKTVQDRVRVLSDEGVSQSLGATDYKDPVKVVMGIDKSIKNTKSIEYANCITAREDRGVSKRQAEGTAVLEQIGQLYGTNAEPNPQAGRVYNSDGLSPTLDSCSGGNRMPKILDYQYINNKISYKHTQLPCILDDRDEGFGIKTSDYCPTQRANRNGIKCIETNCRIRKLTPKECWRLMSFEDKDVEAVQNIGMSDSAMYKQAGNSIITNCVELIAEHLYKAQYDNVYVCYDEIINLGFTQPPMSQN